MSVYFQVGTVESTGIIVSETTRSLSSLGAKQNTMHNVEEDNNTGNNKKKVE